MDDALLRKLTGAAQSDQALAGVTQMATLASSLYVGLVASGVPDDLAADMTQDWFRLLTIKGLWPDAPPPEDR